MTQPDRLQIWAALIVKNEEAVLRRCLDSLRGQVDRIVVIDTGSTDGTHEILTEYAAKSFAGVFQWQASKKFGPDSDPTDFSFAEARNECLDLIPAGAWVLSIDADEQLHFDGPALRSFLKTADKPLYCVPIRNTELRFGFSGSRLFKTGPDIRWSGRCHEKLPYRGMPHAEDEYLPEEMIWLEHLPSKQPAESAERNLHLLLKQLQEDGRITRTWLEIGLEFIQLQERMRALGYLEPYLKSRPKDLAGEAHGLRAAGWAYLQIGLPATAVTYGQQLISLMPMAADGYQLCSEGFARRKEYDGAQYYLQLGIAALDLPGGHWLFSAYKTDRRKQMGERLVQIHELADKATAEVAVA